MASPVTTTPDVSTVWALACLAMRNKNKIAKRTSHLWFWNGRTCALQRGVQLDLVSMRAEIHKFVIGAVNDNFAIPEPLVLTQLPPGSFAGATKIGFPQAGWPTGLEPATTRTTIWGSTIELRPPHFKRNRF